MRPASRSGWSVAQLFRTEGVGRSTWLATIALLGQRCAMDLDAMLTHYFGTTDLDTLSTIAIDDGLERVRIAFGTERETGRRFALWAVLATLGDAPDPRDAFKTAAEQQAAQAYVRALRTADTRDD